MRISDWISDVCSSDLHAAISHRHVEIDPDERPLPLHIAQIIQRPEPRHALLLHLTVIPAFAGMTTNNQISRPIAPAVSTMRFEKPHSLSYHDTTRTSLLSITAVSRLSMVDEAGQWL